MGEKVPRWVLEASRVEFKRLDAIARIILHGGYGGFLQTFGDLWLKADAGNKRLLAPVWVKLIAKYRLDEEYLEAQR